MLIQSPFYYTIRQLRCVTKTSYETIAIIITHQTLVQAASVPPVKDDILGLGSDLSGLSLTAVSDEKKSNNDILALFGNMPKSQPSTQPLSAQQPHVRLLSLFYPRNE